MCIRSEKKNKKLYLLDIAFCIKRTDDRSSGGGLPDKLLQYLNKRTRAFLINDTYK